MTAAFTDRQKAEALWMLDNGWGTADVERRIGCSNASLYTWRKKRDENKLDLPAYEPAVDLQLALQRRQAEAGTATDAAEPSSPPPAEPPPAEPSPVQQTLGGDSDGGTDNAGSSIEPTPLPVPAPAPVPVPNGGGVEPAAVLSASELVAELAEWRTQLDEALRRAVRAESAVVERDAAIAQLRREADSLREQQTAAREVAAEELTAERDKARAFRTTMRYLITEDDEQ